MAAGSASLSPGELTALASMLRALKTGMRVRPPVPPDKPTDPNFGANENPENAPAPFNNPMGLTFAEGMRGSPGPSTLSSKLGSAFGNMALGKMTGIPGFGIITSLLSAYGERARNAEADLKAVAGSLGLDLDNPGPVYINTPYGLAIQGEFGSSGRGGAPFSAPGYSGTGTSPFAGVNDTNFATGAPPSPGNPGGGDDVGGSGGSDFGGPGGDDGGGGQSEHHGGMIRKRSGGPKLKPGADEDRDKRKNVPAMLEEGEYVIDADTVKAHPKLVRSAQKASRQGGLNVSPRDYKKTK